VFSHFRREGKERWWGITEGKERIKNEFNLNGREKAILSSSPWTEETSGRTRTLGGGAKTIINIRNCVSTQKGLGGEKKGERVFSYSLRWGVAIL